MGLKIIYMHAVLCDSNLWLFVQSKFSLIAKVENNLEELVFKCSHLRCFSVQVTWWAEFQ